jgi:hypothetical protein
MGVAKNPFCARLFFIAVEKAPSEQAWLFGT